VQNVAGIQSEIAAYYLWIVPDNRCRSAKGCGDEDNGKVHWDYQIVYIIMKNVTLIQIQESTKILFSLIVKDIKFPWESSFTFCA